MANQHPSTPSSFDPPSPAPDRSLDSGDITADPYADTVSLTSSDVRADPVLSHMAKQQAKQARAMPSTPTAAAPVTGFKARPAPATTHAEGRGPRMTKAAALRLGIKWEGNGRSQTADASVGSVPGFGSTPGHKRAGLDINVASLAPPTVAPRSTKASQLRTGEMVDSPLRRHPAVIEAENKARTAEEKARRMASIQVPSSLSAPTIVPRGNRSSELRRGGPIRDSSETARPPSSFSRTNSALTPTSAANVARETTASTKSDSTTEDKGRRRTSVVGMIKSLGTPSIVPRSNRSAMLRAPGSAPAAAHTSSSPSQTSASKPIKTPYAAPPLRSVASASTSASSNDQVSIPANPTPAVGPRPTKASLLRAGLGAKVFRGGLPQTAM